MRLIKRHNRTTQAGAFLYFIQKMDIDMIDDILEEDREYHDFEKHIFIRNLNKAFDKLKEEGNTFLNRYLHYYVLRDDHDAHKYKTFIFIGNHSGHYFDMSLEIKDGVVLSTFESSTFITFPGLPEDKCIVVGMYIPF